MTVYFGTDALLDYLEERDRIIPEKGHEDALFLSLQRRRMAVRSVENLVKKYARIVSPLKPITPHKLRSTYGTNLYRETWGYLSGGRCSRPLRCEYHEAPLCGPGG